MTSKRGGCENCLVLSFCEQKGAMGKIVSDEIDDELSQQGDTSHATESDPMESPDVRKWSADRDAKDMPAIAEQIYSDCKGAGLVVGTRQRLGKVACASRSPLVEEVIDQARAYYG